MTSRALLFPIGLVSALSLAGCSGGGDEHPSTARDPAVVEQATNEVVTADAGEDTRPALACVPGSIQECRVYYKTDWGQQECPLSFQICMPDGSAWWPCGSRPASVTE